MKKILIILALLLLPQLALAQTSRNPCYTTQGQATQTGSTGGQQPNCLGVGTSTPLPIGIYDTYANITGQATTLIKTGAGILHTVTFNNPTATEVITIFDSLAASGTKIGTITIPASPMPVTLTYDVAFTIGLTFLTATASSDITISFK